MAHDQKDGGYKSRKLWFAVHAIYLGLATGILAARWPSFSVVYSEFLAFLGATTMLYIGGNIGSKFVTKDATAPEPAEPEPEEPLPNG